MLLVIDTRDIVKEINKIMPANELVPPLLYDLCETLVTHLNEYTVVGKEKCCSKKEVKLSLVKYDDTYTGYINEYVNVIFAEESLTYVPGLILADSSRLKLKIALMSMLSRALCQLYTLSRVEDPITDVNFLELIADDMVLDVAFHREEL